MWIEKLKSGKYRAVERYTEIMTGKQKKVSVTMDKNTAATRKAAETALIEKIKQLNSSGNVQTDISIKELTERWRAFQKKTVKASTYKRNYHAANTLMGILGENTLVSMLSAGYIMDRMMQTGKSPGTINEHIVRLKSMLRWGYEADLIEDISYLSKLKPLKNDEKKEKLATKFLESEELKILIDSMEVEKWKDLTSFLSLTGLRIGEAFALEMKDIDTKERQIHVTKTYDPGNNLVTSTKTTTSTRDVYIQDELLPLCRKLNAQTATEKLIGGNGRIFFNQQADFYGYEKYFRENTDRILGRKLTPHSLRHTHVALLAENGVQLETISRRLGHSNSRITRDVYFHVTKRLKEKEDKMLRNIRIL